MKRTSRDPAKLSESLQRHLGAYAMAASAAGVGMLALAQPVEAKIVYTKAHVVIDLNSYLLDLNHDGVNDFELAFSQLNYVQASFGVTALESANRVWETRSRFQSWAAPLPAGKHVHVGFRRHFARGMHGVLPMVSRICAQSTCNSRGPWTVHSDAYLGLKFYIKGQPHYGWAHLQNVTVRGGTLTGYAYETVPNKAIIAGQTKGSDVITLEPGSLGVLAAGASRLRRAEK